MSYRFLFGGDVVSRRVTLADLEGAHVTASELLADARRGERTFWQAHALGLIFGGLVPLLGHLVFDWPILIVLLAVALDTGVSWLGDAVRSLGAGRLFLMQAQRQRVAEDTVSLARAMNAYREPRDGTGGLRFEERVDRRNPVVQFQLLHLGAYGMLVAGYLWGVIMVLLHYGKDTFQPATFWLLAPGSWRCR